MRPVPEVKVEEIYTRRADDLLPKLEEIPLPFWDCRTHWRVLVENWFVRKVSITKLEVYEGLNEAAVFRVLAVALHGKADVDHDHRLAACAFLFSQWVQQVRYVASPSA